MAEKEAVVEYFKSDKNKDGFDRELVEFLGKGQFVKLNWPKSVTRYHIIYERENQPLEPVYFWLLNHLRYDLGFFDVVKVTDIFSASESSAFFGVAQQKLGAQQDKVAQFLRVIHDIFKGLVLLVRDMRIIDEKLVYFRDSLKSGSEGDASENTLKSQFVDLVEGGAKSPMSVLGLASQAQFTILPDLFFNTRKNSGESDEDFFKRVDSLCDPNRPQYSKTMITVLSRKLKSYYVWKEKLSKELENRRMFTLKYIRQQYNTVLLYMNWVKPYLRNIKRLQWSSSKIDAADFIAGFDSSLVEIEFIAKAKGQDTGDYYGCVMAHFEYRSKPSLNYQQEYQRGPSHTGEVSITLRSYGWSNNDIEKYKKFRDGESLELLYDADDSIKAAMDSIGDELNMYLEEAESLDKKNVKKGDDKSKKSEEKVSEKSGIFSPLKSAWSGAKNFVSWIPFFKKTAEAEKGPKGDRGAAETLARKSSWILYKNFKKAHKMITW